MKVNGKVRIVALVLGAGTLALGAKAEERLFLDVITNETCLGLSHAIVCAQANHGSVYHVFDGVTDAYYGDHRYLLAGKAQQLFIDHAPGAANHAGLLAAIASKRMGPKRYRLSRVTGYENGDSGIKNNLDRAPCEWYLYGLCRGQINPGNVTAKWASYADQYTNGVQSILLDHRKNVVWPKKTCNPQTASATYPYEKDSNWLEFAIDEKFADWDFVGYRLYCVDSAAKQNGADITFGLGQFEVYVDYEDFSANASDFEIRADNAVGAAGFAPAIGAAPAPGTVCTAPATYVDADGATWYLQGWTLQSRILGWRDTDRGFTPTYTIPARDGYLHRLVWNYERHSPRKATRLFSADRTAALGLTATYGMTGAFSATLGHLFDGVCDNTATGERALGYIYQGCSATVKFTGAALSSSRLVPCGYRVVETDYENNNTSTPGRSPTAWNLYGLRANGRKVLIASEKERQSIAPMVDETQKPMLPKDLTGVVYPLTSDESDCREGFVGFVFEPCASIWYDQDPTGARSRIDFCLNEVEIFVETNGLSEITVASDITGTGFTPELGTVLTEGATLTPPATLTSGGLTYRCAGYRRETLADGTWTLAEESDKTDYTYDPSDKQISRIVWKWRLDEEIEAVSLWQHVRDTPGAALTVTQGGRHFDKAEDYRAHRAFDGDLSSNYTNRWLANLYSGDIALTIGTAGLEGERLVPQSYTLLRSQVSFVTCTRRAPAAWVLYGIPEGCENETNRWVELDRQSGVYWSNNSWGDRTDNPLRDITRTYPISVRADVLAAGFASYRFVPLRTYLYDLGTGYDQTIDETSDINFSLSELTLNVMPCGRSAIAVASEVTGAEGFLPAIGTAFRTAFEGTRTCTAPATLEADGVRYASAGYAIETLNERTGEWVAESTGEGTTCAVGWTEDGAVRRLLWKWTVTGVQVNGDPENGTERVTYSSGNGQTYRPLGESVTLTATGNTTSPISTFECWAGDVEGVEDISNATITVSADRAKRLYPKFLRNWAAIWSDLESTTYITDGNWTFAAILDTGKSTFEVYKYVSGSGDLDFRGKITNTIGNERWVESMSGTYTAAPITSFTAPETMENFKASFYQTYTLTNLVFDSPALTSITYRAFARCKNLRRVTFGPRTRRDLDLVDEPFLCEYPNQHPDEIVFRCGALPELELLELVKAQNEIVVERSLVLRVDRTQPGWRSGDIPRRWPTDWELYYTAPEDRKNFRGVFFSDLWAGTTHSAKIIYLPRDTVPGFTLLVK